MGGPRDELEAGASRRRRRAVAHSQSARAPPAGRHRRRGAPRRALHLAWYIAPRHWANAPENLEWVTASLELARAFREAGGRRLVGADLLEYDWGYGYCSELRTPCVPHTLYGTSKHALRLLIASGVSARSGTSVAWGRMFNLFGPHEHQDRLIAYVIRSLLQGERARCSHGRQVRDYLFAGDVASGLVALVERDDVHGPINIASGLPITLRALVQRVGDLIGRPDLIDFGAIPAAATDAPLVVGDVTRHGHRAGLVARRFARQRAPDDDRMVGPRLAQAAGARP